MELLKILGVFYFSWWLWFRMGQLTTRGARLPGDPAAAAPEDKIPLWKVTMVPHDKSEESTVVIPRHSRESRSEEAHQVKGEEQGWSALWAAFHRAWGLQIWLRDEWEVSAGQPFFSYHSCCVSVMRSPRIKFTHSSFSWAPIQRWSCQFRVQSFGTNILTAL